MKVSESEHNTSYISWDKFAKFTTLVHLGTKINLLDLDVKRSKVKAVTKPNMVKIAGAVCIDSSLLSSI